MSGIAGLSVRKITEALVLIFCLFVFATTESELTSSIGPRWIVCQSHRRVIVLLSYDWQLSLSILENAKV